MGNANSQMLDSIVQGSNCTCFPCPHAQLHCERREEGWMKPELTATTKQSTERR